MSWDDDHYDDQESISDRALEHDCQVAEARLDAEGERDAAEKRAADLATERDQLCEELERLTQAARAAETEIRELCERLARETELAKKLRRERNEAQELARLRLCDYRDVCEMMCRIDHTLTDTCRALSAMSQQLEAIRRPSEN